MAFGYQIIKYSFSIPLSHLLDRMDGVQVVHYYFLPISMCDLALHLSLSAQMLFLIDIINFFQTFLRCFSGQHLSTLQQPLICLYSHELNQWYHLCFAESKLSWCVGWITNEFCCFSRDPLVHINHHNGEPLMENQVQSLYSGQYSNSLIQQPFCKC